MNWSQETFTSKLVWGLAFSLAILLVTGCGNKSDSNSKAATEFVLKLGGKVVIVGGGLSAEVIPEYWMWKEVQILGSFAYVDEFDQALDLFRQGKVSVEGMISDVIGLEELPQTMLDLSQPTSQIKVMVQPNQP